MGSALQATLNGVTDKIASRFGAGPLGDKLADALSSALGDSMGAKDGFGTDSQNCQ